MNEEQLNLTFAALSDPTRRAILARLLKGEASVAELAEPFPHLTPRAISKHVAVLEGAGLIERGRDAQRRPSRLRTEPLVSLDKWLGSYRRVWDTRFDQLDARLQQEQKQQQQQQLPPYTKAKKKKKGKR